MRLTIGFIHHIDTSAVAQFIPTGHIRIMRQTNCIDIGRLHHADILLHAFFGHHTSCQRIVFVTVDTTQSYGAPIDQQLSVVNGYPSETDFLLHLFNGMVQRILQRQCQRI